MILAAGRGQRMMPLTADCPKPLLPVNGKPLIVYHIENLVAAGITEIVINHAWLGKKIEQQLADGSQFGASIEYSAETDGGLETAGGIVKALPLLAFDNEPFIVINGDIWTDYDLSLLKSRSLGNCLGHLVLVNNPQHNPRGDFILGDNGLVESKHSVKDQTYTFSGIGLYSLQLFTGLEPAKIPLAPILRQYMMTQQISGELYQGCWTDVGTPQRLEQIEQAIRG